MLPRLPTECLRLFACTVPGSLSSQREQSSIAICRTHPLLVSTCQCIFALCAQVAWLRVDTQTILTIHSHVITKNHRISVVHTDEVTWYLKIRDVKETDRGFYMCQINTDPMKSQVGYLDVVGQYASVLDLIILDFAGPSSTYNIELMCSVCSCSSPGHTGLPYQRRHGCPGGQQCDVTMCRLWLAGSEHNVEERRRRANCREQRTRR